MSGTCSECGGPLGPESPRVRTVLDGRIRVTVPEASCLHCGETFQSWRFLHQFFDRAEEILGESPKTEGPELVASFDDITGWMFAAL